MIQISLDMAKRLREYNSCIIGCTKCQRIEERVGFKHVVGDHEELGRLIREEEREEG